MKKSRVIVRLASRGSPQAPLSYDWLEHDFAKDPSPLIEELRSNRPLPKHLRLVLIDLFERYRLIMKLKAKRIPSYRFSQSEAVLKTAADEIALRFKGPISQAEMDNAVKVLEARAKRGGRGRISFDPKAAAQQLREDTIARIAAEFGLKLKTLKTHLAGKRGSSRRQPPTTPCP